MITRHFIDVDGRRVHYRMAGNGPALLMLHQSPRSSAEYEPLIARWSEQFTCIAPDMPGFGLSTGFGGEPDINAYGGWVVALLDALGLGQVGAYGFHSGAIVLINALRRAPHRFTALGCGGYAVWTPADVALLGDAYTPHVPPTAYGEHLTWLWNRVLEQSWFFPWYAVGDATRLEGANDDPERVAAVVRDMLDSGDGWRAGYRAVLAAPRDLPGADAAMPPVLIAAYDGDPLKVHIDRLGPLPAGWRGEKFATVATFEAAMLAHLRAHPAPVPVALPEAADEGFVHVAAGGFGGLLHWRGEPGAALTVHPPGGSIETLDAYALAIDLPGHGLSDDWPDAPIAQAAWRAVIDAVAAALGASGVVSAPLPAGDPARLFPDLSPDRFGAYLAVAWGVARAAACFDPWYEANAAHARPVDPAALTPERLTIAARSLLRAGSARAAMVALGGER